MWVFIDSEGEAYRGHLFQDETTQDPEKIFQSSVVIHPDEFTGLLLRGDFRTRVSLQKALVNLNGRIVDLEPLTRVDFEKAAARIAEMNLSISDRTRMIRQAGFTRGFGTLIDAGAEEGTSYESLFKEEDVLPPLLVASPAPHLPSDEAGLADPVTVKLRGIVSVAGGVRAVEVVAGISSRLDSLAIETVRNSWVFLPAVSKGKVVESQLVLNVTFAR